MSNESTTDRDSALAALIACLDPLAFPHDDYTAALDRAGGDVPRAAEILLLGTGESGSGSGSVGAKRKLEHYFAPRGKRGSSEGVRRKDEDRGKGNGKDRESAMMEMAKADADETGSEKESAVEDMKEIRIEKGKAKALPLPGPGSRASSTASSSACASASASPTPGTDRAASASAWATLLKPPPAPEKPLYTRAAPIRLATPAAVAAADIPLALLTSPLSPQFAAALYYEMIAESRTWPRNRWFLAGREVESNHQSTSYARPGGGFGASVGVPYFYASKTFDAKPYPPLLAKAASMVEDAVNAYLATIPRYAWEYRGRWRANMCAANRYDGAQATVGWHADQMTYLGPYPTIASLSLGTPRAFRLRQTEAVDEGFATSRPTRTYEVQLGHNSLCLMTPGCQERYKHTVPPQRALDIFRPAWDEDGNPVPPGEGKSFNTRINITFRFYRDGGYMHLALLTPDFHPSPAQGPYGPRSGTPICKCGIPTLLRADQKAKARRRLGNVVSGGRRTRDGTEVAEDDMAFFWQCQSPGTTGSMKGCGFFKILDMRGEGRGPCIGYDEEGEDEGVGEEGSGGAGGAAEVGNVARGDVDGEDCNSRRTGPEGDDGGEATQTRIGGACRNADDGAGAPSKRMEERG